MSEVITTVPVNTETAVRPIPSPVPAVGTAKKCKREECKRTFQLGTAFVPPMQVIFSVERQVTLEYLATSEGRKYMRHNPLTREEILKHEFCSTCKRLASFKMFLASHTICLMDGWRAQNEEWMAKMAEESRRRQTAALFVSAGAPRKVLEGFSDDPVSLAIAIKTEDKHKINEIIAEGGRPYHSHKPQRKRAKGPRQPKVQSEPVNHKKSKNKKGESQKKGGKKGRK